MTTHREFQEINLIYQTIIERLLRHPLPLPEAVQQAVADETVAHEPAGKGNAGASQETAHWIELLNLAVTPHLLRTHVLENNPKDSALRSLIRFLVSKPVHSQEDHDKVDWLVTHLFSMREGGNQQPTAWPKMDVNEILSGMEFPNLSMQSADMLMEMPALIDEVKYFRTFNEITDSHIIQRARDMKNLFGEEFFHPEVLTAVVNYNLFFGKQFHALFQDTLRQVHEFAKSDPSTEAPDERKLLSSDYRLTGAAFSNLGKHGRKEDNEHTAAGNLASQQLSPEQQLKQMGVDAEQESLYLRNRVEEMLMRVRGNANTTSIPNSFAPLKLDEWEAGAMRNPFPESEQSFRADYARGIIRAIAIVFRIYEEIPQYLEKKGTEFLWKRHHDSLVYLLYEGRNHKDFLLQLAASSGGRGLNEKARQLQSTAKKLDVGLGKVAELF